MNESELQQVYAFAKELALKAGREIKTASDKRWTSTASNDPDTKLNSVDLVTATDQAVEKLVISEISKRFPSHKFIGEESFAAGQSRTLTDEPTWITDPIDGTTNFVHGFPSVCISIGFVVDKIPVIGVIYNPFLDQLYHAMKGHGAYLGERRLPLSHPHQAAPLRSLSEALIGVEWGSLRDKETMDKKGRFFARLAGDPKSIDGAVMAHSLRSIGSAALLFCHVASGSLDCYFEIGCYSWDVCAGAVIAQEAGCKVYGKNGGVFDAEALQGRHFFVVRAIGEAGGKSSEQQQDAISKHLHSLVENWDP